MELLVSAVRDPLASPVRIEGQNDCESISVMSKCRKRIQVGETLAVCDQLSHLCVVGISLLAVVACVGCLWQLIWIPAHPARKCFNPVIIHEDFLK